MIASMKRDSSSALRMRYSSLAFRHLWVPVLVEFFCLFVDLHLTAEKYALRAHDASPAFVVQRREDVENEGVVAAPCGRLLEPGTAAEAGQAEGHATTCGQAAQGLTPIDPLGFLPVILRSFTCLVLSRGTGLASWRHQRARSEKEKARRPPGTRSAGCQE